MNWCTNDLMTDEMNKWYKWFDKWMNDWVVQLINEGWISNNLIHNIMKYESIDRWRNLLNE